MARCQVSKVSKCLHRSNVPGKRSLDVYRDYHLVSLNLIFKKCFICLKEIKIVTCIHYNPKKKFIIIEGLKLHGF